MAVSEFMSVWEGSAVSRRIEENMRWNLVKENTAVFVSNKSVPLPKISATNIVPRGRS